MSIATISPQRLNEIIQAGQPVDLIDVRTPVEFREVHITVARNLPLERLDPAQLAKERNGVHHPLYVVCRSGARGNMACEKLLAAGHSNIVNVEGGTLAWAEAGFPVVRGKKAMALERQVRILAGSIVLLGAVLGILVHPYLLGLSAFIGAGLVFSGLTDTCAMGMMMARMPWNQVAQPKCGEKG